MLYTYYSQYGSKIFLRCIDKNGHNRNVVIDDYKPHLYTRTSEESDYKNIFGENMKRIDFESIRDAKDFADQYKNVEQMGLAGNSNYANQFIIDIYNGETPEFDANQINIGMIDIEVDAPEFPKPDEAKWPVTAITTYSTKTKTFYVLAVPQKAGDDWDQSKSPEQVKGLKVKFKLCVDEETLLREFLNHVSTNEYHLVSGWNSEGFDIPYIINRCYKLFGEKYTKQMLSPFGMIKERDVNTKFGKQVKFIIEGLPHIDYMAAYKKHTFIPRESYRLDHIAHCELGENKLTFEEQQSLRQLYRENFQLYIDYNIQDVNLIKRLDDRLGLFQLTLSMSYLTLSNYEDTLGTVKIWEQLIAKFLYTKDIVPNFRRDKILEDREFEGAYVKTPVPGYYEWLVSFDLNSLYPHIEQQWNIGPETHIPYEQLPDELKAIKDNYKFSDLLSGKADLSALENYKITMAPNFEFYSTEKMSFFSAIKRDLYDQRKVYKKKMLAYEQQKVDAYNEIKRRGLKI